uniref:CSON012724 protein n=1 Tax=Culicoides sonorensis TaxID=179676 RepID=A0A336MAF8_CULSO
MPLPTISAKTLENYERCFKAFDKNGDGSIDSKDLIELMRATGQNPTTAEVEHLIHEVDENGDGKICFEEFIKLMAKFGKDPQETEEQLRAAFKVFDKNQDGQL